MTRAEHLDWCKKRAIEICDRGDVAQAWASMTSDLQKHDDLRDHVAIQLGTMQLLCGFIKTPEEMKRFIEGFN